MPMTPPQRKANRFRSRGLGAVAAGLGAAGASREVDAAIISDLTTVHTTGDTFSLDGTAFGEIELVSMTNMMGELTLALEAPAGMMGADSSTVEFGSFPNPVGMMNVEFLQPLFTGDVDGTLSTASDAYLVFRDQANPSWGPNDTFYAGFTFDPSGSLPLYGWVEVSVNAAGDDFTLTQWAYDDTGAPIGVGAVPEPGTALLVGLGLAGFAVYARRRAGAPRGVDG